MSKRKEAYLGTTTMRATAHSLSLASSVLGFEIVELWSDKGDGKLHCTYVHCEEDVIKKYPDLIVGHFPNHKREHRLSPKLCELAMKSKSRYHWRILDEDGSDGSLGSSSGSHHGPISPEILKMYQDHKLPFKTEMAYLVEGVPGGTNVFIVALSMEKKDFKMQKLKFLQGVAYAIYVAAFDLDEESEEESKQESSHELDAKEHLPTKPLSATPSSLNLAGLAEGTGLRERSLSVWHQNYSANTLHSEESLSNKLGRQSITFPEEAVAVGSGVNVEDVNVHVMKDILEEQQQQQVGITQSNEEDTRSEHQRLLDAAYELAPTWDPTSDFSFPIVEIPVINVIPCDLSFDNFSNVRHFADGSHSNVFTASYLHHQTVVIKMIKEESQDDETAVREFDLEHGVLARIQHKNVVNILGAGDHPRRFIVLEFLSGGSLNTVLRDNAEKQSSLAYKLFKKPTFTYANLLLKAKEMAQAFHYLHCGVHAGAVVLHRDLKPDNIGFTADGTLKLFDFGLVTCVRTRERLDEAYEMTGCTGSLRYMAPEVALKLPYTEKVDVYSFGVLLWQMAKDKTPFKGLTKDDFMTRVAEKGERPKLDKNWPTGFSQLMTRCWDRDPAKRPSFGVVVDELNRLIQEDSEGTSSHSRPWNKRTSSSSNNNALNNAQNSGSNSYASVAPQKPQSSWF